MVDSGGKPMYFKDTQLSVRAVGHVVALRVRRRMYDVTGIAAQDVAKLNAFDRQKSGGGIEGDPWCRLFCCSGGE